MTTATTTRMTLKQIATAVVKADPTAPLVDLLDEARAHDAFAAHEKSARDYDDLCDAMDNAVCEALKLHGGELDEQRASAGA